MPWEMSRVVEQISSEVLPSRDAVGIRDGHGRQHSQMGRVAAIGVRVADLPRMDCAEAVTQFVHD